MSWFSKIEIRYLKNKPIIIEAKVILKNFTKNILLNLNKSFFFRNKNKIIELNHDEIDVAIGMIIKPMLLK